MDKLYKNNVKFTRYYLCSSASDLVVLFASSIHTGICVIYALAAAIDWTMGLGESLWKRDSLDHICQHPRHQRGGREQTPLVSKGLQGNNVKNKIRKPTTTGSIHIKLKVLPTNFGLLNCQSIKQNTTILNDWIVDNKLDIAVLTETWLTGTEVDKTIISEICPLGYTCVHVPRKDRRGGGIAIILKKGYKTNIKPSNTYSTFEHMIVSIVSANLCTITLMVLYRPQIPACTFPRATTPKDFLTEFDLLLEVVSLENNILIVGDFNYDWVG